MIRLTGVSGSAQSPQNPDAITLSRAELQRARLRRRSAAGLDVCLDLPAGTVLRHGDVLRGDGHQVMVQQLPEMVITVMVPEDAPPSNLLLLGHSIGNLHRPVSVGDDRSVSFPVQDASEEATFRRMFAALKISDMRVQTKVFVPHRSADVGGHA